MKLRVYIYIYIFFFFLKKNFLLQWSALAVEVGITPILTPRFNLPY